MGIAIRPAVRADAAELAAIYNHHVLNTHVTFDVEPLSVESREAWIDEHPGARYRVLVAVEGNAILGYASSGRWRPRAAYDPSVETSVYCGQDAIGRGVGRALYRELFDALSGEDIHRFYAGVALPNDASVALHERFGFKKVALFSEQGRKFGRYWDVAWFERPGS